MASISVPIEKPKHYGYLSDHFGSSSGGYGRASDPGPPYIVKLLHLPVTADDSFIEDLFKSRFTSYVKFKIVVDPSSNILESHVIKNVAFVELTTFQELTKVLKWQDLFYKGGRRVVVERADFGDFQYCMQFNQEHEQEIKQIQHDHISERGGNRRDPFEHEPRHETRGDIGPPLRHHVPQSAPRMDPFGAARRASFDNAPPLIKPQRPAEPPQPPKPRPNPFGAAKPVDIIAKEHEHLKELELKQKLAAEKKTTEPHPNHRRESMLKNTSRRPSVNLLKRPSLPENDPTASSKVEIKNDTKNDLRQENKTDLHLTGEDTHPKAEVAPKKPGYVPAAVPSAFADQGNGKSLADILSSKPDSASSPIHGRNTPTPKSVSTPKPVASKPVILKKKPTPVLATVEPVKSEVSPPVLDKEPVVSPPKVDSETTETGTKGSQQRKSELSNNDGKNDPRPIKDNPRKERRQDRHPSNGRQNNHIDREGKIELPKVNIAEPNKSSFGSTDRPDFKKHLSEITKKLAHKEPKPLKNGNKNGNRRHNLEVLANENATDASEVEKSARPNNREVTQAGVSDGVPQNTVLEDARGSTKNRRKPIGKEREGKGQRYSKDGTPVKNSESPQPRKTSETALTGSQSARLRRASEVARTESPSTKLKRGSEPKVVDSIEVPTESSVTAPKTQKKDDSVSEVSTAEFTVTVDENFKDDTNDRGIRGRGRGRGRGMPRGGPTRGVRARGGARAGRGAANYNLHYVREKTSDEGPKDSFINASKNVSSNTDSAPTKPKAAAASSPAATPSNNVST